SLSASLRPPLPPLFPSRRSSDLATIWTDGPVLRAREASSDMRASIDQLVEKLERQVTRYRKQARARRRRPARTNGPAVETIPVVDRKGRRLNSSHEWSSYADCCL